MIERLGFIHRHFGDIEKMALWLPGGIAAGFAMNEIFRSFIGGSFLSTILAAQVFAEHQLAAPYAMAGDDSTAKAGFKALINKSVKDRFIRSRAAKCLHELREMRNPYTHHRPLSNPDSLLPRVMKWGGDPHKMLENDAERSLEIIADLLHEYSPWNPPLRRPTK